LQLVGLQFSSKTPMMAYRKAILYSAWKLWWLQKDQCYLFTRKRKMHKNRRLNQSCSGWPYLRKWSG